MNAGQVIKEIQRLPDDQLERVYEYLFSTETELDRVLASFDRLPRTRGLTEDEILELPRMRPAGH